VRQEPRATERQRQALAAYVACGGSISAAATALGISPSTAKRHLADLRARFGLSTEQLIYVGQAAGWLVVPTLESRTTASSAQAADLCRAEPYVSSFHPVTAAGRRQCAPRGPRATQ
jgi:DNA-binding NarL/FixJ family response regulator